MLPTPDEKRRIIERRILTELKLYAEQYNGAGMKIQILACKYAKATADLGGFPDFIERMRASGLIAVEYSGAGARTVSLPAGKPQATPKVWF